MPLNKSDILKGAKKVEEVELESLEDTVYLRGLTQSEYTEIQAIQSDGADFSSQTQQAKDGEATVTGNAKKMMENLGLADRKTAMYGLNNSKNEEWTLKEVGELPPEVVNEMADKVFELTNIKDNKKSFRNDTGD